MPNHAIALSLDRPGEPHPSNHTTAQDDRGKDIMFRRRARGEAPPTVAHVSADGSGGNPAFAAAGESSSPSHEGNTINRAGVYLRTVKPGDACNYPQPGDSVRIYYDAFLKETGEKFDSSRDRGQVFCFRVGEKHVVAGLELAVGRMSLGQIAEITIPYELAYGAQGYPPLIPPRHDLVFVVELIGISST